MTVRLEQGQKIGNWEVIKTVSDDRNHNTKVLCKCVCGNEKLVWKGHLLQNKSNSCGCIQKTGPEHKDWKGYGEISANFWDSIQRGANGVKGKRVPIEFAITIEYAWNLFLQQDRKCALTNIELYFNYAGYRYKSRQGVEHTASLDRIDSSLGYIEGNVQWVHKDINMMKRTYDQDYFIEMCRKVANGRI